MEKNPFNQHPPTSSVTLCLPGQSHLVFTCVPESVPNRTHLQHQWEQEAGQMTNALSENVFSSPWSLNTALLPELFQVILSACIYLITESSFLNHLLGNTSFLSHRPVPPWHQALSESVSLRGFLFEICNDDCAVVCHFFFFSEKCNIHILCELCCNSTGDFSLQGAYIAH